MPFAEHIQQLFGDDFDPDPLFLEESWTLGIPAAAENLCRRRQNAADREFQNRAFRDLNGLGSLFIIEDHDQAAEALLADRADMIATFYASAWSQRPAPSRSPADSAHDSHVSYRRMPAGVPSQNATRRETEPAVEPWNNMSVAYANQLLGTSRASTRQQIRSAYRRLVSEWHPDRLQDASGLVRESATQKMSAINEAYRLLRTAQIRRAA